MTRMNSDSFRAPCGSRFLLMPGLGHAPSPRSPAKTGCHEKSLSVRGCSSARPFLELLAHRALDPPPSSSLAEERTPRLAPSPCGGARFPTLAAVMEYLHDLRVRPERPEPQPAGDA